MASYVIELTDEFDETYADIDLVVAEAGVAKAAYGNAFREVLEHLQAGELDQLDIRPTPKHPNWKTCAILPGIVLVFEIKTDHSGPGAAILHHVQLLAIQTSKAKPAS